MPFDRLYANLAPSPPCEVYNCEKRLYCKHHKAACRAFQIYVNQDTTRQHLTEEDFDPCTDMAGHHKVHLGEPHPTEARYGVLFTDGRL